MFVISTVTAAATTCTRTCAVAPSPACLTTLVNASCTTRYATASTAAGNFRSAPDIKVGRDAGGLHAVGQSREVGKAGSAAEIRIGVAMQYADDATKVGQRIAAAATDNGERLSASARLYGDQPSRTCLYHHHAHAMRDDVVQDLGPLGCVPPR